MHAPPLRRSLRCVVVQPVIPIWVTVALAFAAPVFALIGVVVGAVMNRRTTRLQLEAGRQRDRELWAREDRHRFAEQKRVLYAEYLTVTELVVDALLVATFPFGSKAGAPTPVGKVRPVLTVVPGESDGRHDRVGRGLGPPGYCKWSSVRQRKLTATDLDARP